VGKVRLIFNIFVVWMLTGFWHGADWNFVLWGLYFAVLLLLEKFFIGKFLERLPRALSHIYLLFLVLISFVIFNASGMDGVLSDLTALFGGAGLPLVTSDTLYYLRSYAVILILGIAGATPLIKTAVNKMKQSPRWLQAVRLLEGPVMIGLLFLITAYLVDGSFNPFLYFRF